MSKVRAKKFLGQHFLTDLGIAREIANSLSLKGYESVLEVGPGMGVLTQFLLPLEIETYVIEIDRITFFFVYIHQLQHVVLFTRR